MDLESQMNITVFHLTLALGRIMVYLAKYSYAVVDNQNKDLIKKLR